MNYRLISRGGGGIFSEFMDIFIMYAIKLPDINNLYLELNPESQLKAGKDCFNFVLEQSYNNTYEEIICDRSGVFRINGMNMELIKKHPTFGKIKELFKKIKIKKSIIDKVNGSQLITGKTLGVHIRIIDMNEKHPIYGTFTLDNYINKIKSILNDYDIDNIFVASDNHESLYILSLVFGNMIKLYPAIRGKTKDENTWQVQFDNANNKIFWEEAFIDMLLLSKCKHLLCRTSNLANAAIVYSNTLTDIHWL